MNMGKGRTVFAVVMILVVVGLLSFVGLIHAGMPDLDWQAGYDGEGMSGRITATWGFGAGQPLTTEIAQPDNQPAAGIGGAADERSWGTRQVQDNWGKWLTGLAGGAALFFVADNNWLHWVNKSEDRAAEIAEATDEGATAGGGGAAVNGNDNVVVQVSNGGTVNVYQDSPVTSMPAEEGEE